MALQQVAQVLQVHLPARVERQVGGESRGVVMSIEQLIDETREVRSGHACGGFECDMLETGELAHGPHGFSGRLA